ncbi:MAG TPA: tautomerase family protein [Vicinamibacteria bacterium]|jgi:phenylpyruvate tautomerase PptA (4-oxalocrotonate tautomerase family)
MPLVRITMAQGRTSAERRAIADGVHQALVETANVPADDRFQVVEEVAPQNLVWSVSYLGIEHAAAIVFVQIVLNTGRTVEVKKALYASIADRLAEHAAVRREDVIVSLVEVPRENWSFGGGAMSYPPLG